MLIRFLTQTLTFLFLLGALLLGAAGDWRWLSGWILLGELALASLLLGFWLLKTDPDLMAERLGGLIQRAAPRADRFVSSGLGALWVIWWLVMGLDRRVTGASAPPALHAAGAVLVALAYGLFFLVFRVNSFAAPVVKIQGGQRVIDTGPYAVVRHPIYSALLMMFLGIPFLLGSRWGLSFDPLLLAALVARTVIEENTLRRELPGYDAYMTRMRWRYIPYVW